MGFNKLEKITFNEYVEKEMNKYWNWFYFQSKEIQEKELDEAVKWYNER